SASVSVCCSLSLHDALPILGLAWGSMFSRYGDVFGPIVNLAARMESVARPGTVLVDAETCDAVEQALPGGFSFTEGEEVEKPPRSEEHTSELQSRFDLVCRL